MSITVKNLTKTYGEQQAVNDISFSLEQGEIVGFLGPNGAGKSTTMKMITGYLEPSKGEINVNGIDVKKHPLEAKKKIGYLPESNALYYDMYVREYLSFIAEVHSIKNKKKKIDDVIALTGLTLESKKRLGQLSKGYKQRVGLAAALLHDPEDLLEALVFALQRNDVEVMLQRQFEKLFSDRFRLVSFKRPVVVINLIDSSNVIESFQPFGL